MKQFTIPAGMRDRIREECASRRELQQAIEERFARWGYEEVITPTIEFYKTYEAGFDNINDIEKYRGRGLYVPRDQAVPLREDEYYIGDLIGMEVFTEDGKAFGRLKDVMETGANDVYVIDTQEHGEVLLPAIRDCILEVDVEAGKMKVHLLPGLL